jgi:uncharacterized protein YkwD
MKNSKLIVLCSYVFFIILTTGCVSSADLPAAIQPAPDSAVPSPAPTSIPASSSVPLASEFTTGADSPTQEPAQTPEGEPSQQVTDSQTIRLATNDQETESQTTELETSEQAVELQTAGSETSTQPQSDQPTISLPDPASATALDCVDEAAFYADITIPDGTRFAAGESFEKIWQVRNTGSCTWGDGYALVFASGDVMSAPLSNPLPEVSPGETAEISIDLIVPARGGEQTGNWEFQNSQGDRFGIGSGGEGYIWVQIHVEWSTAENRQPSASQPATPSVGSSNCSATQNTDFENQILSLINAGRAEQGLAPLTTSTSLSSAAREHSLDMACQNFVDHNGSNGTTWYDRVSSQGYANANSARENIYVGDPDFGGTPDGAYSWWMNSQVHRDNILNAAVSEIGIGYVYDQSSAYGGYYTVVFARP